MSDLDNREERRTRRRYVVFSVLCLIIGLIVSTVWSQHYGLSILAGAAAGSFVAAVARRKARHR